MSKPEKLWKLNNESGGLKYAFYCPGCKELHSYIVKMDPKTAEWRTKNGLNLVEWSFNGDLERPTFNPSLLYIQTGDRKRCHLFLHDGKIKYCSDCDHELAGKEIDLQVIPY